MLSAKSFNKYETGIFDEASYDKEDSYEVTISKIISLFDLTCFLSQEKPKKILKLYKMTIGFKPLPRVLNGYYRNKEMKEDVGCQNKARRVAQGVQAGGNVRGLFISNLLDFVCILYPRRFYKVVKLCNGLHQAPKAWFQMSSMGELTFFLGLQVKQNKVGIFISQDKYVAEILKKFDLVNVEYCNNPNGDQRALTKDEEAVDVDVHLYRSMIGSLMYLTASRPDIIESPFVNWKHTLTVIYGRSPTLSGKSTTGGCQFLRQRLISWQCKKRPILATSTTKAEYVAAANCCGQHNLHCENPLFIHSKTKAHRDRPILSRDCYEKKLISVEKIHTDLNVADLLTKPFDGPRFNYLVLVVLIRNSMDLQIFLTDGHDPSCDVAQSNPSSIHKFQYHLQSLQPEHLSTTSYYYYPAFYTFTYPEKSTCHLWSTLLRNISCTPTLSPPQIPPRKMTLDDLLQVVPQLMTKIDSLKRNLKQTKMRMKDVLLEEGHKRRERAKGKKVLSRGFGFSRRRGSYSLAGSYRLDTLEKEEETEVWDLIRAKIEANAELSKDESEASTDADPISGTNIPVNPVPVAMKPPSIATYKIIKQGEKGVYQIVREDGTDIVYINFGAMLKDITRDDLTELYRIVMNRYGMDGPEDELEKVNKAMLAKKLSRRKQMSIASNCCEDG
ncbi:putative ribonuclease H-like domain-containing protein [Tanacetum coccineum]